MMRFFTSQTLTPGTSVTLEPTIQKHAIRVLRLDVGAQFELADGDGHAFVATIAAVDPLVVTLAAPITRPVELPVTVRLVCGVPKGDKADWIVQKATELGASRIDFFNSQWATAKWKPDRVTKKLARLQAIAQGAAEQSHRDVLPTVGFTTLADLTLEEGQAGLLAYEEAAKTGEAATLVQTIARQPQALCVVFGPEGGVSPEEVAALVARGFTPAGLGPRIMRTETAPLYLLSAISALTELQEI
ncbi:MAG: 16S rRNA (uracil(1498)-N(3))-methyltransferase [Lactobacillus sp.]|jgi:16S rRNA (uracil1498-N3)-methyltransferase|nr:16S rRNA (uracil(1498)-N(3))-methyltransferase [Lactobacillus sp.]MCI2032657.1 16S rRNA (uracil(1498)-N(3))-methyltransferase [Lactobacillus sp.]